MFRDNSRRGDNEAWGSPTPTRLGWKIVVGVVRKGDFEGVKCCSNLPREVKELPAAVEKDSTCSGDGNLQEYV